MEHIFIGLITTVLSIANHPCEANNTLKVLTGFCATYDYGTNAAMVGSCLYNFYQKKKIGLVRYYPSKAFELIKALC